MIKDQSNLLGITFAFTLQQQKVLFVFILRNIDIFQKYIDQIDFGKNDKRIPVVISILYYIFIKPDRYI